MRFYVPFGIHTIILIFLLFIILSKLGNWDLSLSLIASLLSYMAVVIFETACLLLNIHIFNISPKTLSTNLAVKIVSGEIHVLLIFISAFLLNKLYIKRTT